MALFETIPYQVIKKNKKIEIRKYNQVLLASTKTEKTTKLDSGFNSVFQYISGKNESGSKISMTTPVVTFEEDNKLVTGFYVPSKFTKESVPKPTSQNVFINELKTSLYVVIKFRGSWTEKNFNKHDQLLLNYIEKEKHVIISSRIIFRYQPPFIPGFLRHNEIAYQIKQ